MTTVPPSLDASTLAHAERVQQHLQQKLQAAGGWLRFETFMHEALYAPGLGYYAAGSHKLADPHHAASSSDFITAPELSPFFGHTLATPVADVLRASQSLNILEIGAGTGALACSLIPALQHAGLTVHYHILEISADLHQRQQARLAQAGLHATWLDRLPNAFSGCVIANEVLDAMPVRLFRWSHEADVLERGVTWHNGQWAWRDQPADPTLADAVHERMPALPGYTSEMNQQAEGWMQEMGNWLQRGAALLIDYGFPQHEYYHPQRLNGTLMCHFRHTANDNPLWLPGLQDITAHIDFTAMADAAQAGGLEVLGYTSQSAFLLDAGLLNHLSELQQRSPRHYALQLNSAQKLIAESEMGELFKVLAVGRGVPVPQGFAQDRLHRL